MAFSLKNKTPPVELSEAENEKKKKNSWIYLFFWGGGEEYKNILVFFLRDSIYQQNIYI
jgi:hypothetical protein